MNHYEFTWGAHLLLWVFPLVVAAVAVLLHFLGGRDGGDRA